MSDQNSMNSLEFDIFEMTTVKPSDSGLVNLPPRPYMAISPPLSQRSSLYSQYPTCSSSGTQTPKRLDEGYASQDYASSSRLSEQQYPSRSPTTSPTTRPTSRGVQTTFEDDPSALSPTPSRGIGTQTSTRPTPSSPDSTDYDRFLTAATIDAILPTNQRRPNPKMKTRRRRRSSSLLSAISPPANYIALQPQRFPHEDMAHAYQAMKAHNSRTAELKKTPQREYQRHLANRNVWQRFAYTCQGKPCYEAPEGCCYVSAERGEDGSGHGHGDGCCEHFGCRSAWCWVGGRYCDKDACCEGCGCTKCWGWEHGCWGVCEGWFGGWTWWCCGEDE